jgi:phosphoribosyl-AMP cyclohydrolase / phosphoribosyl-ATP pyrophosphohydrolase
VSENNWLSAVRFGPDGLVPVVAQERRSGDVLMVAYADREALERTLSTGLAHYFSRSRKTLWRKGETSGHELRLVDLALDCDSDALLLQVDPIGPTCHRDTRSCFDPDGAPAEPTTQGLAWLETLWSTIAARAAERPAGSYTSSLIEGGVDAVGRKVVEEATEVLIAAKDDASAEARGADRAATRDALAGEAADLLYHALVLLAERDVAPSAVIDVLRGRDVTASRD